MDTVTYFKREIECIRYYFPFYYVTRITSQNVLLFLTTFTHNLQLSLLLDRTDYLYGLVKRSDRTRAKETMGHETER